MKKVVHLNTYCNGGAGTACRRINKALADSGMDSTMIALYKTVEDNRIVDFREHLSFTQNILFKIKNRLYTDKLKLKTNKSNELFSLYHAVWNVNDHPMVKGADVVNIHWTSGFLDWERFMKFHSKKTIITLHDHFPFSGGYHYPNSFFETDKWQNEIRKNSIFLKEFYSKHPVTFVGPSQYIIDNLLKSGFGRKENSVVIKNPVDTSIYKMLNKADCRKQFNFAETDKVVLYVNENFKYGRKGFDYFQLLVPALIERGFKIIICGDHSRNFEKEANIIQTGYIKDEKHLATLYNASDLLLFTSYDDNLPNTISESLCCGTPAIAFNTGGIKEMMTENNNGKLLELKAPISVFIDKTEELFSKNLSRDAISKEAQIIYSQQAAAKKYDEVYSLPTL